MQSSRAKKLDHFYSLCNESSQVLDVGVSNNEHSDAVNLFLNKFRFSAPQYTGLAVQPMDDMRKKHPEKKFVEYSGGEFPFEDNKFDWVFSNAVIEHVGDRDDQLLFLNEMLRVGKNVFFTTPNKWFPVESHTNVFFRHWFDESFYKWCKKNKPYWSVDNLLLLGKKDIEGLMDYSNAKNYEIVSNKVLGWPMTFTVVCS
jgi:SAM-dependent methyltransferase